jgi:glycerophosphoryl diester phosphodiesterase
MPSCQGARNLTLRCCLGRWRAMQIFAHRGASRDAPENTLPAFALAQAQGADGVELDVMRCNTGELVVCHDEVLDRLAGVRWELARTPWWKLRRLDVGSRLGFPAVRLALLEEVLDLLPTSVQINIELKCDQPDDRGLSLAVARLLTERREGGRCFLSSFNPLCLVRVARAFPALRRGLLIDPARGWFQQAHLWLPLAASTSVHPQAGAISFERVQRWHARGYAVVAWTVDGLEQARALRAMQVDVCITNTPGALREALGRG